MDETPEFCLICLDTEEDLGSMPCGQHRYCAGCFCSGMERAIAREEDYLVPCGSQRCTHKSLEEVQAIFANFPTVDAGQRDDLLTRYASRLPEYDTPILERIHCSNQACMVTQGFSRFLDVSTCGVGDDLRVRCPDCNATTCMSCKGPSWSGAGPGNHTCILASRDAADYVASLPEDQQWQWQQCGRCDTWVGKVDETSCNHMKCRYDRLFGLSCCRCFILTILHRCEYQFCLLCGQEWEGYVLCGHGCPKYGFAVYDDEGYNQAGYHRDKGLNRAGEPRAVDALEFDELPIENTADEENDGTTERGHIYAVPYLGRIVSSRTTIAIPTDMPSLRASLLDPKFWALAILHTFTNYGLVVLLHNRLEARGFAYNGWGMDRDGYDMKGYSMC